MRLIIGGTRGSISAGNQDMSTYGGDTSSYLVESSNRDQILVDLGTGVRTLLPYLNGETSYKELLVLLSHFHLDHLYGLVLLPQLHAIKTKMTIMSQSHYGLNAGQAVDNLINPPYWPLGIRAMSSKILFGNLGEEPDVLEQGELSVRWDKQNHPGSSTVFRIDESKTGKSIVIATDVEWQASDKIEQNVLIEIAQGSDLLVMDGQFCDEEYSKYVGWGHSTLNDVAEVGEKAGVKQILVTHHAPMKNDAQLEEAWEAAGLDNQMIRLARQGEIVDI
jgi:ribonuclease BN (tRNA processing enzyme)